MSHHDDGKLGRMPSEFSTSGLDESELAIQKASTSVRAASPWLNGIVLWAALGVFSIAYNVSIIASSLGQPTFQASFGFATRTNLNALIGACVGGNQAAGALGQIIVSWFSERYGRRPCIGACALILIIGVALSAGTVSGSWAMFVVARLLVGFGGWPLASLALTYQSEVAITELRGWLTGTVGAAFGLGYAVAAWVGVGLFYYEDAFAWRLALLLGVIPPIGVLIALPFVPESPRWLCLKGRSDEAFEVIKRIHAGVHDPEHTYARRELVLIKAQAEYDATLPNGWLTIFQKKSYRKRLFVTALVGCITQTTAVQVLTSYGPTIYASYGFSPRDSLLIAAGWISLAAIEPVCTMLVLDKHVGRRPLILAGPGLCTITIAIIGALVKYYGSQVSGTINSGGAALIFVIYLHLVFFLLCESAGYVYMVEIWPSHLRAKGSAVGLASQELTATWLAFATPFALANIGWQYWMVFVAIGAVGTVLLFLNVPETKGVPLEEVAALFGDADEVMMRMDQIHLKNKHGLSGLSEEKSN